MILECQDQQVQSAIVQAFTQSTHRSTFRLHPSCNVFTSLSDTVEFGGGVAVTLLTCMENYLGQTKMDRFAKNKINQLLSTNKLFHTHNSPVVSVANCGIQVGSCKYRVQSTAGYQDVYKSLCDVATHTVLRNNNIATFLTPHEERTGNCTESTMADFVDEIDSELPYDTRFQKVQSQIQQSCITLVNLSSDELRCPLANPVLTLHGYVLFPIVQSTPP